MASLDARRHLGELEQVPVLVEILVREIDAVHLEHRVEVLRGSGIGREICGVALLEPGDEFERECELALRAPGVAALDLDHELPDRRQRRPARHAVVGDVGETVGLQSLAHDRHDRVLDRSRHPAEDAVQRDDVEVVVAAARSGLLEARLRDHDVGKPGALDQAPRMRDVLGVEVITLEGDVRVRGGQQGESKPWPKPSSSMRLGLQRAAGRAADA